MEHTPDPRWKAALDHSHYLRNLLNNQPGLIPELLASWNQPLSEDPVSYTHLRATRPY